MRFHSLVAVLLVGAAACGNNTTTAPATAPSPVAPAVAGSPGSPGNGSSATETTVTFSGLTVNKAAVSTYTENGIALTMSRGPWQAWTNFGNPAPTVVFPSPAGQSATGTVDVALPSPAYFKSVDLYGSTAIPYTITGKLSGVVVLTLNGTVPNPVALFRTVINSNQTLVDSLSITISTSGAPCCLLDAGLDTIVFTSAPTTATPTSSLGGTVTDYYSGAPLSGVKIVIAGGPNDGLSTTTDASGHYAFAGLYPGAISLNATLTKYLGTTVGVSVGTMSTFDFTMSTGLPPPPPAPAPRPANATIIGFGGLIVDNAAVSSYSESGFTVVTGGSPWVAGTGLGSPAPSINFFSDAGTTATGTVTVTSSGATFRFTSVDLYSSTTPIPYVITGLRAGATVFTLTDTVPNTLGAFKTVSNPNSSALIDTLRITLTDTSASCCRNPLGLDTIVVIK